MSSCGSLIPLTSFLSYVQPTQRLLYGSCACESHSLAPAIETESVSMSARNLRMPATRPSIHCHPAPFVPRWPRRTAKSFRLPSTPGVANSSAVPRPLELAAHGSNRPLGGLSSERSVRTLELLVLQP